LCAFVLAAPDAQIKQTITEGRAMTIIVHVWKLFVVAGAGLLLASGCSEQKTPVDQTASPVAVDSVAETRVVTRLPVSLNTVMVAMVNQAADPLWVAAWRAPETDKEWRELERRAVQLELAGTLLSVPGTGPADEAWTDNAGWRNWADQLRDVGASAVVAVKARDLEKISVVGDELVEICEGCHRDFKPAVPTGGEFGELSPTPSDLEAQ
jgi:hypothetical protein